MKASDVRLKIGTDIIEPADYVDLDPCWIETRDRVKEKACQVLCQDDVFLLDLVAWINNERGSHDFTDRLYELVSRLYRDSH